MRVGLVACVKEKLDHAAPARTLYVSDLFAKASAYCEANYDRWFVLSALYGLVLPDQVIEPYDQTLLTMKKAERQAWGVSVRRQLRMLFPGEVPLFYLHAGKVYRESLDLAAWRWPVVELPLEHFGIGRQKAWYLAQTRQPAVV